MERWQGKVAVVTGASSGIGKAIAIKLVEAGMKVAGFARRQKRVENTADKLEGAKGKLYPVYCDVTSEEDILKAFAWVEQNLGTVHVLVNNAGIARATTLIDGDLSEWRKVIDTNVTGLCICTREAIKSMRSVRPEVPGHIVHINSIAGHYVPLVTELNVYAGSKHAVTALAKTLRHELNDLNSKIKITSISPGFVKTEIASAGNPEKAFIMEQYMMSVPILNPEDVADAVIYAIGTKPHVMIEELTIRPVGEKK